MLYALMAAFAAVIVIVDQVTKYLTVINIAPVNTSFENLEILKSAFRLTEEHFVGLPTKTEGIPGLFSFTHVHNEGAAFSSFEGQQWLFGIIFVLFTAGIIYDFTKNYLPFTKLERWLVAAIYGGGLGNMIDRLRFGYVVDMISVDFMDFPVFNVADCFITCGCILLMAHLIFFNKEFWKDDKKK